MNFLIINVKQFVSSELETKVLYFFVASVRQSTRHSVPLYTTRKVNVVVRNKFRTLYS